MRDGVERDVAHELPGADDEALELDLPEAATADEMVFRAEIRSLEKRADKNKFWARQEIFILLQNAASAGLVAKDLEKGNLILKRATDVYQRALLTRNRLHYVAGTGLGVIALVILAFAALQLEAMGIPNDLAPPEVVVSLFAFAGIGSVTSVLIRLSTLELNEETSRTMLWLSGASKPLIAIGFASVVYIILKYKLVAITIGSPTDEKSNAAYWVAAFLCGFSERFGSDIIAKLEPARESKPRR